MSVPVADYGTQVRLSATSAGGGPHAVDDNSPEEAGMTAGISLSVLDLVPVSAGEGIEDAFAKSIELALLAERLGFHRFWIGEHHCVDGLGSSRPAILMAAVAARTDRLRIGAGGILLANKSALAAAEEINTLLALFPGRIDIALGRGTGFHDSVRHALAGSGWEPEPEAFATRFADLRSLLAGDMRMPELAGALTVTPPSPPPPAALWMLASSPAGAARAGSLGMPLAFAHHLNGAQTLAAMDR